MAHMMRRNSNWALPKASLNEMHDEVNGLAQGEISKLPAFPRSPIPLIANCRVCCFRVQVRFVSLGLGTRFIALFYRIPERAVVRKVDAVL
jgi:hypothetical protein